MMRFLGSAVAVAAVMAVPVWVVTADRGTASSSPETPTLVASLDADEPAAMIDSAAPVPADPRATGIVAPGSGPEPLDSALWIGKPIVSADGVVVGRVRDVHLDADGLPLSVTTVVGGFFGIGGADVRLPAVRARFHDGEVRLAIVETDVSALAALEPERWHSPITTP